jgi:hypothetical protein
MDGRWKTQNVLITVRTYPVPSHKGIEVSCTAGITDEGKWIRLFPVPYRFLDADKRFQKYQWIKVSTIKAQNDRRPESFKLNVDSIEIGESVSASNGWRDRRGFIGPLIQESLCQIQMARNSAGYPTLGIFRPKIKRLLIEATDVEWTPQQLSDLKQRLLFNENPSQTLEKIPFNFRYEFSCSHMGCPGHSLSCMDWEMGQSYRSWKRKYGDDWEAAFRNRYEQEMISKYDTHFYVGTIHQYPNAWIIVGLFYPPPLRTASPDLFSSI